MTRRDREQSEQHHGSVAIGDRARLGAWLRAERRARIWDVPEMARRLVQAAGQDRSKLPQKESLISSIRRWERGSHGMTERYLLLYCAALGISPDQFGLERPSEDLSLRTGSDGFADSQTGCQQLPPVELTSAPLSQALRRECQADLARPQPDLPAEASALMSGDSLLRSVEQSALGHPRAPRCSAVEGRDDARRVTQIQAVTDFFRRWDNEFGGGLRRRAVIGQLSETADVLDGVLRGDGTDRALLVTAADLCQLAGWMSLDAGMPATAQRYYLLGLRMARDSGDRTEVARLLYCLSRLMADAQELRTALDLAQAGQYAIRRSPSPKASALLSLAEARAYAGMGEAARCRRALTAARATFGQEGNGTGPEWSRFFDDIEFAGLAGAALRDLALADREHSRDHAAAAEPWITQAVDGRPRAYLRSKILDQQGLAVTKLLLGQPDAAAELAVSATDLSREVISARVASGHQRMLELAERLFPGFRGFPDPRQPD